MTIYKWYMKIDITCGYKSRDDHYCPALLTHVQIDFMLMTFTFKHVNIVSMKNIIILIIIFPWYHSKYWDTWDQNLCICLNFLFIEWALLFLKLEKNTTTTQRFILTQKQAPISGNLTFLTQKQAPISGNLIFLTQNKHLSLEI